MGIMLDKRTLGIIRLATISRVFYIGISYVASLLLPRFDKSTELVPSRSCMKFLLSWDAIHFLEIMERGYKRAHAAAFFPLLPYVSRCINKLLPTEPHTTGVLVSCTASVLSSALLYIISRRRYGDKMARMGCVLFIFNPASIVYTAMYSESLFMLLFLLGIYFIENNDTIRGTLFLSLCGLCRSNSILFAPFVMYPFNRYVFIRIAVVLLPLAAFQYYSLLMINRARNAHEIFIPYSHIQKTFWEQGLFRFFTFKNIPNVFVGLPFILISLYVLWEYWTKRHRGHKKAPLNTQRFSTDMCAVILLIQTLITIFLIHWNMHFRFVSFNPLIYWTLAEKYYTTKSGLWKRVLFRFFFGFGIAYAVLFGCFYPPC